MSTSLNNHSTKQEGSFPNKATANLVHCSRQPSTHPTLLQDPDSRTVTFTQCTQLTSQLHTTTASITRNVFSVLLKPPLSRKLYSPHPSPAHYPRKQPMIPTPHTPHHAVATHTQQSTHPKRAPTTLDPTQTNQMQPKHNVMLAYKENPTMFTTLHSRTSFCF